MFKHPYDILCMWLDEWIVDHQVAKLPASLQLKKPSVIRLMPLDTKPLDCYKGVTIMLCRDYIRIDYIDLDADNKAEGKSLSYFDFFNDLNNVKADIINWLKRSENDI